MAVKDFPARPQGAPPDSVSMLSWLDALGNRQSIDNQQELTSVASGDEIAIFDVSETGNVKTKKATVANIAAGAGAVIGPASAIDGNAMVFDGATGKLAKDGGSPFRKNAIINGDFQVWQEGTSFAAMAGSTYIADNWRYDKVGAMVHAGSRSADVPTIVQAGRKINYSLLIDCTTVDAAIAASDYALVGTFVEGYNFVHIAGVGLCCQFWHKHTKTGTYCVGFRNSGADRGFVREYTQAVSDTWEFASVLVDASPAAGTWDYTTGIGLRVSFALAAGTNFQTAAGAWAVGDFYATANQVNACDSIANNFMLAGVQLEKGSVATEFEAMKIQDVEDLCERYFRKTFDRAVAPVQSVGNINGTLVSIVSAGSVVPAARWAFGKGMRVAPTIVTYNPSGANANWTNSGGVGGNTAVVNTPTTAGVVITASTAAASELNYIHATANARF